MTRILILTLLISAIYQGGGIKAGGAHPDQAASDNVGTPSWQCPGVRGPVGCSSGGREPEILT